MANLVKEPRARARFATTWFFPALCTLAWVAVSGHALAQSAEPAVLQPFSVTLSVTYRGISAGKSHLTLERMADGRWHYASSNRARGLFKLVFPDEISQHSELLFTDTGVRPLRYVADDGSRSTTRDIELRFDWQQRTVSGIAEQQPVTLRLGAEDALDPMSVQLALMQDLLRGQSPDHYWLADKTQLKRYVYRFEGNDSIKIAGQTLDTVIWASHREGSDRVTRVWHAKELGFLPLRAERRRGNSVEWTMLADEYSIGSTQVRGKVTPR